MSMLRGTVFLGGEFALLVICSIVAPMLIYRTIWARQTISRATVLFFGLALIAFAGIDIFLLQVLTKLARLSPSLFDNIIFDSELTVALYLLPTLFAGTGINIVSHLLIHHLGAAERRFD
jgi:hypothetical protein